MTFSRELLLIYFDYNLNNVILDKCLKVKDSGVMLGSSQSFINIVIAFFNSCLGFILQNYSY